MTETVADLRDEIRDLLDVHHEAGSSGFRSRTLEDALESIGGTPWGGAPSLRGEIRREIDAIEADDSDYKPLRKAELRSLRDALAEVDDGE